MAWEMSQQDCICFMQDQCECVDDADDWCWCGGKDGFEPWMMSEEDCAAHGCDYYSEWSYCSCEDPDSCASAGGEPNCQSFAPMAFKGNFTVEMCIDCSNVTVADDLGWAPDGSIPHGSSMGWCYSELDDDIGCTASPGDCWAMCEDARTAMIWWPSTGSRASATVRTTASAWRTSATTKATSSRATARRAAARMRPPWSLRFVWGPRLGRRSRRDTLKCGEGREPGHEGDAALHAMGDDAEHSYSSAGRVTAHLRAGACLIASTTGR